MSSGFVWAAPTEIIVSGPCSRSSGLRTPLAPLKLDRRAAENDPSVIGGSASTRITGRATIAYPHQPRALRRSGRSVRAVSSRPTAAIVRSTAPIGTSHAILAER